ncbi:hypothetical protein AN8302.2 [Aspergillus nidulans FGSC A4]|uniref:DUF7580 domain-containing protein n=1 Tax=Emericella nidulans (strain FGSC A4 / ATCC 38163 / CBS 112.46 / NRRL 194 / M139) TaxID=227321 RepID=Q5ATS8_EMENI|nr:hypothetical protein [Aspergillus nidulans FGSC A4]EAA66867.1 hypothetical protein AN8302.2 [Aspergillus nidulans FGSC A4]CBF80266.1 TPA: conserved hypothetical protein [Aspergillus nidulans FGSC A4]|eukprot:XP_681571.1 hypothetical protein AN8302.2 [Aspergillus nidulans FGSC A4]
MVTGIEVAGLILGSFPLIISGLEHYGGAFESMKEWIRFRAEFAVFMNALCRQKIFFRQNIEDLLSSVVDSEYDMACMLDDPDNPGWKDPDLEWKLKKRLSGAHEYDCCMDIILSIHTVLGKLESKLHITGDQNHQRLQVAGVSFVRLEFEFRRFTYTLGKKRRQKLMGELEKSNEDTKRLLGNSDRLEPMRKKRTANLPRVFHQFRLQAASLHKAIARALRCTCRAPHSVELLLSRGSENIESGLSSSIQGVKLHVYFPLISGRWAHTASHSSTSSMRYAAEVEMACAPSSENQAWEPGFDDTSTAVSVRSKSTTDPQHEKRGRKVSIVSSRKEAEASSSIPKDAVRILDICASLGSVQDTQPYLGLLHDGEDNCHIVRTVGVSDGILSSSRILQLVPLTTLLDMTPQPESHSIAAVHQIISAPPLAIIPRQERLCIALTLARAVLQLQPGPWLKHTWSKNDVYLFQTKQGTIETQHPVLISHFAIEQPAGPSETLTNTPKAVTGIASYQESRTSLLSLGIIIMELWFGKGIETLPFRNQFLGPDGMNNEFTDFNTAQKWQEQTLEEGGVELHNITRRCIYCAFNAASQDLNNAEFRQAVYDDVAQGLQRILARYEEG